MPTKEYEYVSGKLFWVKHKVPEAYGEDRFWSVTIYPDAEGMKAVSRLREAPSVLNKLKEDDDGEYIRFKRACQKKVRGTWRVYDPPTVLDREGKPLDDLIGNGSDGTVKLEVYKWSTPFPGKAARWESLKVDNLVPYTSKRDNADYSKVEELIDRGPLPRF